MCRLPVAPDPFESGSAICRQPCFSNITRRGRSKNLHSMKSNLRNNSKPVSPLRNGPKSVTGSCTNALPHLCPVPGLTLTNYYHLDKIGFVPLTRTRSACSSSLKSTLRPLPVPRMNAIPSLDDLASQPMPFFALRAPACTNPTIPALLPSPRITLTKNGYLLRIGFVPKKPASTLLVCLREAHRPPPIGRSATP